MCACGAHNTFFVSGSCHLDLGSLSRLATPFQRNGGKHFRGRELCGLCCWLPTKRFLVFPSRMQPRYIPTCNYILERRHPTSHESNILTISCVDVSLQSLWCKLCEIIPVHHNVTTECFVHRRRVCKYGK